MTTAYYVLPQFRASLHAGGHYLSADSRGRFAVQAGSADEATLIRDGAIPINVNGQILGDQLANAGTPAPGSLGEYLEQIVLVGAAIVLTTATPAQIAVLTLPAGDWDVDGFAGFLPAGTTSISALLASSSLTTAQIDSGGGFQSRGSAVVPGANAIEGALSRRRYTGGQSVYLNAEGVFTVAALSAYGTIRARRAG
jgi:hypothetical protein